MAAEVSARQVPRWPEEDETTVERICQLVRERSTRAA
jgi:hypothetical protein